MSKYTLFHPTFKDRATGELRESATYHVRFRDHRNHRQTFAADTREQDAHATAAKLMQLVRCRRTGEPIDPKLARWIEARDPKERKRLVDMELIDPQTVNADTPLIAHLRGLKDEAGNVTEPGFEQHLIAKGNTAKHVHNTVTRVETLINECGFIYWRDLVRPAAVTRITVYVGEQREKGEIRGQTANYYIRDIKSFCRWLAKTGRAPAMALAGLDPIENAKADSRVYRALTVEELQYLLPIVDASEERHGLTGDERAILYRFGFETAIRPGQLEQLTVASFKFTKDGGGTVTSHAKHVKRRTAHTQDLTPGLAATLRERFKTRLPTAQAFRLPNKPAEMLRRDLADARREWINEKGLTAEQREERQRSDFLADVNHAGEVAVFYSTRHGHGTALADAGVPEKDIAASMHHTSPTTTRRYLHATAKSRAKAIAALPDLRWQKQVATGTDGKPVKPHGESCFCNACADLCTPMDSSGQKRGRSATLKNVENARKNADSAEKQGDGLLAELADAVDSKSTARKGISVRLR